MADPSDVQPVAEPGTGPVACGQPVPRIDGRDKVTGRAPYAAEHFPPGLVHGVVVNSTVARGRIVAIDTAAARAVPGVLEILSHAHRPPRLPRAYFQPPRPGEGAPHHPFADDQVRFSGQPVALVLARTLEAAQHAASLLWVRVEPAPHATDLVACLDAARAPDPDKSDFSPPPGPKGDAERAWHGAPVQVDAALHCAVEHHNPMEPHATTVAWEAGRITVVDKTQGPQASQQALCRLFGLDAGRLVVRNPFVGGAFGSGLRPHYQCVLALMAALHLRRSVRVVLARAQMFTIGHRPETWQRVRLAADRAGRLLAVLHDASAETSRREDYTEPVAMWSGQLYACEHVALSHRVVALDRATPLNMRAPGAAWGVNALEMAMDELAEALGMDPLALRLANDTDRDPVTGRPYASRALRACWEQGAARFGWDRRDPRPGSMRAGHELVGWGMATGQWSAGQQRASARAVLHADGRLEVCSAASDIGTGTYTAMAQIAAATLGLPLEQVVFRLGDSRLPQAPTEGGSTHLTSVGSAVQGACLALARRLREEAGAAADGAPLPTLLQRLGRRRLAAEFTLEPDERQSGYVRATHSGVFCEVRVDPEFGTVRVTRVVSAVDCGRIVNPLTARSQVVGGIAWGIGQALHEASHCDPRLGRFMNHDYAGYHVPVNADLHEIEVLFVEQEDRIASQLGAKGCGEIGIVGVAAAVANAVWHATGRRMRSLPFGPEDIMAP